MPLTFMYSRANLIRKQSSRTLKRTWHLWVGGILVGLISVVYSEVFHKLEVASQFLFTHYSWWMLLITPACFVAATWIVQHFAPYAAGSGIPQVIAAVELESEEKISQFLSARVAVAKILSSFFGILGGGAMGREGPTAQISASVFWILGKQVQRATSLATQKTWVVAGSAAGIAAAFNTPLGGITFAIEELTTMHFRRFKSVLIYVVIIAGLVSQAIGGSYLYLGLPVVEPLSHGTLFWVVCVGILSGGAGAYFGKILFALLALKKKYITTTFLKYSLSVCMGLAIALLALLGDLHVTGAGRTLIVDWLQHGTFTPSMLFYRFVGPLITYLSGGAGGIFAPALCMGAAIGHFMATFFHLKMLHVFTMMGMAGFLCGVTRTPLTSFVLVFEMTGTHDVLTQLMLATIVAYGVARLIERDGFYFKTVDEILSSN